MEDRTVFQCSFGDGYAGSARMALYGCTQLAKRGYDVTLFASQNSLTAERAQNEGTKTIVIDTSRPFDEIVRDVSREFERHAPRYFISYHSLDRKVSRAIRSVHGKTFFNIADRQNISQSFPIIGSFLYNMYFDYLIACSDGVARSLYRSGILKRKVRVIYNAIDVPGNIQTIAGNNIRRSFNIDSKIVLGVSAWFHKKRKGFDILFNAFKELDDRFVLLIVGIPESDQPRVLAYASEFTIAADRIVMPGYVSNIWEFYKAMDIFLLPSRSEGFSLALLEAAAARRPIVASNIPGTNEFLCHEENGILFDVMKPRELSAGIKTFVAEPAFAQACADRAMRRVGEKHTIDKYGDNLASFLDEISAIPVR